jgi:HlyD family secretion protein
MNAKRSIRAHIRIGLALVAVLVGGTGGWAALSDIAGAVIATGTVVVDSNIKKVQHPSGGIVGEIRARDSDQVVSGDLLVRLDDTLTSANLAIVSKGLDELSARKARLEAEREGDEAIKFPDTLLGRASDAGVAHVIASEARLFEIRRLARNGLRDQLRQRIVQLEEEVRGYTAQERAKATEISLIARELKGARELWDKNLMPITKLTQLEREAARLEGERGQFVSTMAQARGKIAEIELQIMQIDRDLSSEVGKELREIDAKIGEFVERKVAAEDQLKRIDIRAPQDGMVHQSTVHTVGGVVTAGETLMLIVPQADKLIVEAKVAPQDIDQLRIGQTAVLRFSAFNQRTTPEIKGTLSRISADAVTDQRTGLSYYTIRIALSPQELERLGAVTLVPGMPVEVFVQTGERKVLSYLTKPLHDQIVRAFREK